MEENLIDEIGPWSEVKLDIVKAYASVAPKIVNDISNKYMNKGI